MKMKKICVIMLVLALLAVPASATITTTDLNALTKEQLVSSLLGPGITVTDISITGANVAIGTFSDSEAVTGISQGVILSSGDISDVDDNNNNDGTSTSNSQPGDADLTGLIGESTYDAIVLEITFIPEGSQLEFNYVFGSEEYNEYVYSYNDVFAFFLNGENIALIPGTSAAVTINNVNLDNNPAYYKNNDPSELVPPTYGIELDGFTTVLKAVGEVNPGQENTIKIAIADTADSALDSVVLIEGGSFSSADFLLSPESATNNVGETHTLTAELKEVTPNGVFPLVGETVNFVVTSGPNEGLSGSAVTDSEGIATWSYSSSVAGKDTIKAFVGSEEDSDMVSNTVINTWVSDGTNPGEIPEFPTIILPMAAILGLALVFMRRK